MIHEGPLISGWVDHGFYNFQPTLFFDLALHNSYEFWFFAGQISPFKLVRLQTREEALAYAASTDFPDNPVFFVVFRKADTETDFAIPIQGYYNHALSKEAHDSWQRMR